MERNPNRSEKRVSAIPTQAMMPRTNRTGLMPKLGEAGPEERTICMPGFDYGAVKQARQVIPDPGDGQGTQIWIEDARIGEWIHVRPSGQVRTRKIILGSGA